MCVKRFPKKRHVSEEMYININYMTVTNLILFISFHLLTNEMLKQKIHSNLALLLIHVRCHREREGAKDINEMKIIQKRRAKKRRNFVFKDCLYTSSISTSNELFIYHNVYAFEKWFSKYNAFRFCVSAVCALLCVSSINLFGIGVSKCFSHLCLIYITTCTMWRYRLQCMSEISILVWCCCEMEFLIELISCLYTCECMEVSSIVMCAAAAASPT